MYMKDFKLPHPLSCLFFTILINFYYGKLFSIKHNANIMQCNSMGISFLFNAKIVKMDLHLLIFYLKMLLGC